MKTCLDGLNIRKISSHSGRYLIVINELGFVYSHFWGLAETLVANGWEVFIAGATAADPKRALDAGMRVIPMQPKVGIGHPLRELGAFLELRGAIREVKPDVLHLVSLKNVLLGGILAAIEKVPAVLGAVTGLGTLFTEDRVFYRALRRPILAGLRFVFAHRNSVMALENPDDRQFFVDKKVVARNRTFLVPGAGVDPRMIFPAPASDDTTIILCVSRMIRSKGILHLIEAARVLHSRGLKFQLKLVGDIDPLNPTSLTRKELESATRSGYIEWLGRRSDVRELLNRASIFCLPSYYGEGLPRSLVEASAAALPIVTTNVAGCREVVLDGETGYIVPAQDIPALANALGRLLEDHPLRRQMGLAGRLRFEEKFTDEAVLRAFKACYSALHVPFTPNSQASS